MNGNQMVRKATYSAVEMRLAELAIGLWQREPSILETVRRLVLACGGQWTEQEDGSITAVGTTGIRVGFHPGCDPITSAVSLAFLFLGPFWPMVVPGLLPAVNKRWRDVTRGA